jgi:hypothetical protein
MTWSLPLSYWSPEKLYTTSSLTATSIYIATWVRVKFFTVHSENELDFRYIVVCIQRFLFTDHHATSEDKTDTKLDKLSH